MSNKNLQKICTKKKNSQKVKFYFIDAFGN